MTTATIRRRAGALGISSVPLLVAGFLLIGIDAPGSDEPGREYVSYFTDNSGRIWIGTMLSLLGIAAFLAFAAGGLRDVLRRSGPEADGLSGLAVAAATAWALFTLVGVTLIAGTAGAADFFEGFILDPDTARLMLGMSWLPSIYGGLAACVVVTVTSLGARRTGALPKVLVRAGFVVAAALFVGAFVGVAGVLFALWVLAVGVVLVRRSGPEAQRAALHPQRPVGSTA
jgi:hypothetical protein